ncbi:MAG: hypothetical protein ACI8T1_001184 [Verrucomicrobiales bacterium]|jgi:hypothetical protein
MVLVTRFPPAIVNGLADIDATLGSYSWPGFIAYGLSPYKKRLALLGAQRLGSFVLLASLEEPEDRTWAYAVAGILILVAGLAHATPPDSDRARWTAPVILGIGIIWRCCFHLFLLKWTPLALRARWASRRWIIPESDYYLVAPAPSALVPFILCNPAPWTLLPALWNVVASLIGLGILVRGENLQRWKLTGPGKLVAQYDLKTHQRL